MMHHFKFFSTSTGEPLTMLLPHTLAI